MDLFKKTVLKSRLIKPQTLKLYCNNLNKLSKTLMDKDYEGIDMFKDTAKVEKLLNTYSIHKRRVFISTILIAISPTKKNQPMKGYQKIYKYYNNLLHKTTSKYMNERITQVKNEKEQNNWVPLQQLKDTANKLYEKAMKSYNFAHIQRAVVACIFTDFPPRRSDIADCLVITKEKYDEQYMEEKVMRQLVKKYNIEADNKEYLISNNNYLVVDNANNLFPLFFSFGNDKNKVKVKLHKLDFYGPMYCCRFYINKTMNTYKVLHHFLTQRKELFRIPVLDKSLLYDKFKNPMSRNGLSKYVGNIFKYGDKRCGITLIRHIYVSEMYSNNVGLLKKMKIAFYMNHSHIIAEKIYAKHNKEGCKGKSLNVKN